ncbi:MAG: hypothetical protein IKN35_00565 [Lachnospiraceae bacterium]|nr:hypothetical protein [Lachnospiraceae bacterium]
MLALRVNDVNNFMKGLVAGNLFDPFLMIDGQLNTAVSYTFDGRINKEFYASDSDSDLSHSDMPPYEYQPWTETKGNIFSLIKGTRTPLFMRFTLALKPDKALEMLTKEMPDEDFSYVKLLLITIKYENSAITLTTGTSQKTFVMSHDADNIWDKNIQKYLSAKGVDLTLLQ